MVEVLQLCTAMTSDQVEFQSPFKCFDRLTIRDLYPARWGGAIGLWGTLAKHLSLPFDVYRTGASATTYLGTPRHLNAHVRKER